MSDSPHLSVVCPHCQVVLNVPTGADLAAMKCPQCQEFLAGAQVQENPAQADETPAPTGPIPTHLQGGATESSSPPAVPGLKIDLAEDHARGYRPRRKGMGIVWIILSGISLTLLAGAAVVSLLVRMVFPGLFVVEQDTDTASVKVIQGSYKPPTSWAAADKKSLRVGGLKVKIERIELGPVLAKAGTQEIIESDNTNIMQIYFSLENESEDPFDYTSWYGNSFTVGDQSVVARLQNDRGEPYSMLLFDDAAGIFGHVPRAIIRPKETLQDSIVFEVPASEVDSKGPWKLELPQAAFGLPGSLGFLLNEELLKRGSVLETSPLGAPATKAEPGSPDE